MATRNGPLQVIAIRCIGERAHIEGGILSSNLEFISPFFIYMPFYPKLLGEFDSIFKYNDQNSAFCLEVSPVFV